MTDKTPLELRDEAIDKATDAGFELALAGTSDKASELQKAYLAALAELPAQDRRIAESNLRARLEQHYHEAAQATLQSKFAALDLDKLVDEPVDSEPLVEDADG